MEDEAVPESPMHPVSGSLEFPANATELEQTWTDQPRRGTLRKMNTFDFTITMDQWVEDLGAVDALYGRCDDVSMFNSDGVTKITFHRDATSLDDAVRTAVSYVQSAGYKVEKIEVEPECVGAR